MPTSSVAAAIGVVAAASFLLSAPVVIAQRPPEPDRRPATLFAVGDIMHCSSPETADATGRLMQELLDSTPNSRGITLGDNSNDDGSEESYRCLDRTTWGRLMPRLYPTPGNHDYQNDRVLPFYFLYFVNAGAPDSGYYAYDFGAWRIYALNTELMADPDRRDTQLQWLERDLRAHANTQCTMAYYHRPTFSSGRFASPAWTMRIFRKLYKHGVDLVVTGHEHFFASMPPLSPDGTIDRAYGIPGLIAGTGGAVMFERPATLRYGGGEQVVANTLGVLRITLQRSAYEWAFVPVDAQASAPAGQGTCHDNPPGALD